MKSLVPLILALTGCTSTARPEAIGVVSQVYSLSAFEGEPVGGRQGRIATVTLLSDGAVVGTSACNSIGPSQLRWRVGASDGTDGTFDLSGQGAGIITTVGCSAHDGAATAERFWRSMESARSWSVDRDGLRITFADGSTARLSRVIR